MNIKMAYKLGVVSGLESAKYGEFFHFEVEDEESFMDAGADICQNKRQYAGHPGYDFNSQPNAEALWDEFERGEGVGLRKGWRLRRKKSK